MAKLNHLIEQILAKIEQREHQSYEIDYQSQALPPDEQVYTDYANVVINDVTIGLLLDLYRVNTADSWVNWILQGISFEVRFTFEISESMVNFIPKKMLHDWPINFVVDGQRLIVGFYQSTISRKDLAGLPDKSIIVLTPTQKLTMEAEEICPVKEIIKKIRTDEDCIWQK